MHFKDEFNNIIGETTIYHLSKISGIERTKLQRIKTGKRLPSYDDIDNISDSMMLTPSQRDALRRSLTIDLIGEDKYKSRIETTLFLNELNSILNNDNTINFEITANYNLKTSSDIITTNNSYDTQNIISAIIKNEIYNNELYIVSDTNNFIFKQLCQYNNKNTIIKHLITFKQNNNLYNSYSHNIKIIKNIFPLFLNNNNYIPYFSYKNQETDILLPYYIITDNYSINFSSDYSNAIITKSKKIINEYKRLFETAILKSNILIKENKNIFEYSEIYLNSIPKIAKSNELFYSFEYEPCIIPYIGTDLLNKYINSNFQGATEIKRRAMFVFEQYQKIKQKSFFTENGINNFLKTGRIIEIPDFVYEPISLQDRKLILNKACDLAETSQNVTFHLIKHDNGVRIDI